MNRTHWLILFASCLILSVLPAAADVVNGDFEDGGSAWNVAEPSDWTVSFPATGGYPDGNASIQSRFWDSQGEGCVSQVFLCGEEGTCNITFDATMNWIDSNELAGRLKVYVNGALLWTAPDVNEMLWTPVLVTADCGTILLDLCLEVDPGNNMWRGRYDNVSAECDPVAVDDIHWGMLKSYYR